MVLGRGIGGWYWEVILGGVEMSGVEMSGAENSGPKQRLETKLVRSPRLDPGNRAEQRGAAQIWVYHKL